jgi:two-component system clock-associated histidine kinase SasA
MSDNPPTDSASPSSLIDPARDKWVVLFAHDLRKPLASMISSLHLLGDMLALQEYDQLGLVLRIASESGGDLMAMLDSMPRNESGPLQPVQPIALRPVLVRLFAALQPLAEASHTPLHDDTPEDLPPVVIDETGLTRVLRNLLENALRYAPGGPLRVGAVLQTIGGQPFVEVSVIDSGAGIPPEERDRIFEYFYRAPQTASRVLGYGLGLPFCKVVVERYGGAIWVGDGPTGGAAFYFTLPAVLNSPDPLTNAISPTQQQERLG